MHFLIRLQALTPHLISTILALVGHKNTKAKLEVKANSRVETAVVNDSTNAGPDSALKRAFQFIRSKAKIPNVETSYQKSKASLKADAKLLSPSRLSNQKGPDAMLLILAALAPQLCEDLKMTGDQITRSIHGLRLSFRSSERNSNVSVCSLLCQIHSFHFTFRSMARHSCIFILFDVIIN